jgi:hypothetical protein
MPEENGQEPKPRFQRQEKCAAAATKGKTKDKTSRPAQPFVPVRQELSSDCGSEDDGCANMALVMKAPPPLIDYQAMNAQFCDYTQYCRCNKSQSANEDEVRFSALASMGLADDYLVGSRLSPGTPSSLPRNKMVNNQQ